MTHCILYKVNSLENFNNSISFLAVYVTVGYYHDHIGLMLALDAMQLLDSGMSFTFVDLASLKIISLHSETKKEFTLFRIFIRHLFEHS